MTTATEETALYAMTVDEVVAAFDTDLQNGLTTEEAAARLDRYGPNSLPKEAPPSFWKVAWGQIAQPMNVMLIVVTVLSLLISQFGVAILVGLLVLFNVMTSTSQEIKARASVEALDELQVPTARVVRSGNVAELDAVDLVPGDVVLVEAGDFVPSDGRIARSATLEVQEAALTGESAPVAKDASTLPPGEVPLGDRVNMAYQNTSVTRGTARLVVTATGTHSEMGKIAGMLQDVTRQPSPLERELTSLTKWLGVVAWVAVAIIFVAGLIRGLDSDTLVLLCVMTAISAIPAGLPTFVQIMLSSGAQRLADSKAVVKSLTDVETLGSTSAINSDKTGTLTLNQMTATTMFTGGQWYTIEGNGYDKQGAILHVAGDESPDFEVLGYGLALCSDATVADDGTVVGDPTEAALVVLAAKAGVDAAISRRELPRIAAVPFDSEYKFMATYHLVSDEREEPLYELVKGAPDVVLDRCTEAYWKGEVVPVEQVRDELLAANRELSERGLRVLSFAARRFPASAQDAIVGDPMGHVSELVFVSLVGIIDPLRPEAKAAVATAHAAGIEVRMITGDHAITAKAIADDLDLGPGVITGPAFEAMPDDQVKADLDNLHVFGRVAPEDKLRLVALMQEKGDVVAMTGDAVNDAAALKQADIGVAMGSGSEVSKQAAKMILTDDNFATLVHAVELGRDIYNKVTAYIAYQLTGMFGLLIMMLLATVFNINSGVALTPGMILYISLFISIFPVLAIMGDTPDPDLMEHPPRDSSIPVFNRATGTRWVIIGMVLAATALIPLVWGPDEPQVDGPSISMTMTFAISALSTVGIGVISRRDPGGFWNGPVLPYFGWLGAAAVITVLGVELTFLQRILDTVSLTGSQWLGVFALSLAAPLLMAAEKAWRRHQIAQRTPESPSSADQESAAPQTAAA